MVSLRMCLWMLLAAFPGAGCVGGRTSVPPPDAVPCVDAYAYAPSSYVINIVGGDTVLLDPMDTDFHLYCDAVGAQEGLRKAVAEGRAPQGDWKIFRVHGIMHEIGTEIEPGVFLLTKTAPLADWVD